MKKGFVYILECADGSYYTGSTKNLEQRLLQHRNGEGANHTKKRLPVKLVYFEGFSRIDEAFYREKQIQGWSRKKKEALIEGAFEDLRHLSMAYRDKGISSDLAIVKKEAEALELEKHQNFDKTRAEALESGKHQNFDKTGAEALEAPHNTKPPF